MKLCGCCIYLHVGGNLNKKVILKKIIILMLLAIPSTLVLGQNSNKPFFNETVLFKITDTNPDRVSYLFGTHHAFGKTFFDSLVIANQALSSCQILIKENLNIPGHSAEDIINSRPNATQWNKYLNKEDLNFVNTLFTNSPTDFNKMTPTEMYVFLTRHFKQQICLSKEDTDTSLSLDDYIASKAQNVNLKLVGLETTEEQIELINKDVEGMPRKLHKRRLTNIIHKIRTKNSDDCAETDWYNRMEIDYQLSKPCGNSLVLTDRNNKWMKKISELLETNNCFIAVGLSHLMYECGLINQLENIGYIITPMKVK